MVFGKHINKYYLKYSWILIIGIIALSAVDIYQLKIPEIYSEIIYHLDPNSVGALKGLELVDRLKQLCLDMLLVVAIMVVGRCLWRVCFFGSAVKVETELRRKMFDHCKNLSQNFYQKNKVGNMMSLFTNDIETINECFGDGVLMLFDAIVLGGMAIFKMFKINPMLTSLALVPMAFMGAISVIVGKYMMNKWKLRQEAFSELSDFSQESFSGIAVIKAFVKEGLEIHHFAKINSHSSYLMICK